MLLSSPAGNDLLFDEALCEQGRNFANKIWNAFRLVKGWSVDATLTTPEVNSTSIRWFEQRFNEQLAVINDHYAKYRMSDALMASYKLVWDDFCSWYLEMVKPAYNENGPAAIDATTYNATLRFFEQLLKVLHPWMPFISEELWHHLNERQQNDCIIIAEWPKEQAADKKVLAGFEFAAEVVAQVRNIRSSKGISPRESLSLFIKSSQKVDDLFNAVIVKLANLDKLETTEVKVENSFSFLVGQAECYVPVSGNVDVAAEKERIQKELEYNLGFRNSVQAKLANERFVANAKPDVVDNERKKLADAEAKILALEEQLQSLK
jgi:valyl-tRNA synthetase